MRTFVLFLFALTAASGLQAGDVSPAELKELVERLAGRLERLEAEVERQRAEIGHHRSEIARLEALSENSGADVPVRRFAHGPAPDKPPVLRTLAAVPPPARAMAIQEAQPPGARDGQAGRSLAGFRFSGLFRLRYDLIVRDGNRVEPALQNSRMRYRAVFNADRALSEHTRFRLQLATGPPTGTTTFDQDFTSTIARHPFMVSEAYVEHQFASWITARAGKTPNVFEDGSNFFFDPDARFNGFQQVARLGPVELRGGQYIFTNPNVLRIAPGSPLAEAGEAVGSRARAAALFHQGAVFRGGPHELTADLQLYRQPNQIQLSVVDAGRNFVSRGLGIELPTALSGLGNATRRPGGAGLFADQFHIAHLGYRVSGPLPFGRRPHGGLHLQVARNIGTARFRDALMLTGQLGRVRKPGDLRLTYLFAYKDASSMIAAFSDTDLGAQTTVNIRAHQLRLDVGVLPSVQFQNVLSIVDFLRSSRPEEGFFVPFQAGAKPTFRYQSQIVFVF